MNAPGDGKNTEAYYFSLFLILDAASPAPSSPAQELAKESGVRAGQVVSDGSTVIFCVVPVVSGAGLSTMNLMVAMKPLAS